MPVRRNWRAPIYAIYPFNNSWDIVLLLGIAVT